MFDLRGGGLDSVGLHMAPVAALEGHDVAWIAEHPLKGRKGLVSQRSVLHRRELNGSEVEPAGVLEVVRAEPVAVRLDLVQHYH
eukprot:9208279-Pyramimonas_sp.AAC.1